MFARKTYLKDTIASGLPCILPHKRVSARDSSEPDDKFHKGWVQLYHADKVEYFLEHNSLARTALLVDEYDGLINGGGNYERTPEYPTHVLKYSKAWDTIGAKSLTEGEDVFVPAFDITSPVMYIPSSPFDWHGQSEKMQRNFNSACDFFLQREEEALISLLKMVKPSFSAPMDDSRTLSDAFLAIEQHNLIVCSIICGEECLKRLKSFKDFDHASYLTRFAGHIWTADVYLSKHPYFAENAYVLPSRDVLGVVVQNHRIKSKVDGSMFTDSYRIGMAIMNEGFIVHLSL